MLDKDVLGYNLEKIAKLNKFYNNIEQCATITDLDKFGKSCESSMAVNGTVNKYEITQPQKEEPTKALSGNHRGVNYTKEGFGLYKPEHSFRILNIHFHPTDSYAIPSEADMCEIPETSMHPIIEGLYVSRKVEIVGHKENDITTLFLKQFIGSIDSSEEKFGLIYSGMEQALLDSKEESKTKLSHIASDYLNTLGHYVSRVISFGNKEEYMNQASVFNDFEILDVIEEINLDDLDSDEETNKKNLEEYLNDLEEENDREQYGIRSEDDDPFLNIDDFDF